MHIRVQVLLQIHIYLKCLSYIHVATHCATPITTSEKIRVRVRVRHGNGRFEESLRNPRSHSIASSIVNINYRRFDCKTPELVIKFTGSDSHILNFNQ